MAFTRALYYPWIDITDEVWLKNAALYWDTIETIVPSSKRSSPYSSKTAQKLLEAQILKPYEINPGSPIVMGLEEKVNTFLDSAEGAKMLQSIPKEELEEGGALKKKLSDFTEVTDLHPEKLPDSIRKRLEKVSGFHSKSWLWVNSRFAEYYMTLLAAEISFQTGSELLTDFQSKEEMAENIRLRTKQDNATKDSKQPRLVEGTLARIVLETIQLKPDTPISEILAFRKDHQVELGKLRQNLGELAGKLSASQPHEALVQQCHDLYENQIKPSISTLKDSLNSRGLATTAKEFLKVASLSAAGTSLPVALLKLGTPEAIGVLGALTILTSAVTYYSERTEEIKKSPYTYLLSLEKKFGANN